MSCPPDRPLPLPPPGARLRLVVEAMDDEGRGRAQVGGDDEQGYDVAVRGALPGDRALALVERVWKQRRLVQARAVEVDEGPAHAPRTCQHRAPCPGCPLHDADPGFALELKRARLVDALAEHGLSTPVDDVRTAGVLGLRQKVKLMVGGRRGHLVLGLYAPHSHALVSAHGCPHTRVELPLALEALKRTLEDAGIEPDRDERPGLRAVIARAYREGVAVVLVSRQPPDPRAWRALTATLPEGVVSMSLRLDADGGNSVVGGAVVDAVGPTELTPLEGGPPVPVDAFCQPVPELARELYREAAALLTDDAANDGWFLDAYAGTGGFARALRSAGARDVVAVERSEFNVDALRAQGFEVLAEDVHSALPGLADRTGCLGAVADPPRKGLGENAAALAALGARRLVLVSCAPSAMGRDLVRLSELGYRPTRVIPYDLFPGTPEVEAMTLLERA